MGYDGVQMVTKQDGFGESYEADRVDKWRQWCMKVDSTVGKKKMYVEPSKVTRK